MFCIFCVFSCIIVIFSRRRVRRSSERHAPITLLRAPKCSGMHISYVTHMCASAPFAPRRGRIYICRICAVQLSTHAHTHLTRSALSGLFVCRYDTLLYLAFRLFAIVNPSTDARPFVHPSLSVLLMQVARTRRSPDATHRAAWPRSA